MKVLKLFGYISVCTIIVGQPVFAAESRLKDEQSRIGNQIFYYNPSETCGGDGVAPVIDTGASTDSRVKVILEYLVGKGMTLASAAGVAGNMKQESGLNPFNVENASENSEPNVSVNGAGDAKLVQDNNGKMYTPIDSVGFGLVQWTFGGYKTGTREDPNQFESRQGGLYRLALEQSMDIADINLQLMYVWQELSTHYKVSTLDKVIDATDPVEAAVIIHDNYEVSADSDADVRRVRGGNAKGYYDQYRDSIADGSGATSSPTETTDSNGDTCADETSSDGGVGEADGLTFPLQTTQAALKRGIEGAVWCYQNQNNCHHDYNAADIFADTGTPILAAKPGKVVSKTTGSCNYSGCNVSIKGDDGFLYYYTHMNMPATVNVGQTIQAAQEIGKVGTNATAMNTPRHLHFDITRGNFRPSCSGSACNDSDFINVQPVLIPAFNNLPPGRETEDV